MKLRLDKVSAPATGSQSARILRAVKTGKPISTPQGKTFIASLVAEESAEIERAGHPKRCLSISSCG